MTIELTKTSNAPVSDVAIESLVMRGDISALEPAARAVYYIELCRSLRLNPATQPIKFIAFQGKTIPYFTRDATDQLASIYCLNREIVAGPELRDFAGHKVLYALCRASLPNGRVETATAVVSPPQGGGEALCNAIMRTETKARRRATLAILGLGFISEDELDTMSDARRMSHAEAIGSVDPVASDWSRSEAMLEPSNGPGVASGPLAKLRDYLADGDAVATFDATLAVYDDLCNATDDAGVRSAALSDCLAHLEGRLRLPKVKTKFRQAANALEGKRAAKKAEAHKASTAAEASATAPVDAAGESVAEPVETTAEEAPKVEPLDPRLEAFVSTLASMELPGEGVGAWIQNREVLKAMTPADREMAWKELCKRVEQVGKMANAKVWLRRAIAEEDARAHAPESDHFA